MYPILDLNLYAKKISRGTIASRLGISTRTFSNKMHGKTPFTWNEVKAIHDEFFPDIPIEELFKPSA